MNSNIKQIPHVVQPPLSIEREITLQGREMILIEGVRYDADYFRTFAHPDMDVLYAVRSDDSGSVTLKEIRNADEAQEFFEEIASGLGTPAALDPRNDMEVDDGL